jgi:predicted DNA-binding protein (MmcQ/YjbR family)
MKYYSEDEMKDIREAFEKEVLGWPDIGTKKMFGCPCYKHKEKLFAFLVTDGLVMTKLDEDSRAKLSKSHKVSPFSTGNRDVKAWVQVQVTDKKVLKKLYPYVRKSYDSVLEK